MMVPLCWRCRNEHRIAFRFMTGSSLDYAGKNCSGVYTHFTSRRRVDEIIRIVTHGSPLSDVIGRQAGVFLLCFPGYIDSHLADPLVDADRIFVESRSLSSCASWLQLTGVYHSEVYKTSEVFRRNRARSNSDPVTLDRCRRWAPAMN